MILIPKAKAKLKQSLLVKGTKGNMCLKKMVLLQRKRAQSKQLIIGCLGC